MGREFNATRSDKHSAIRGQATKGLNHDTQTATALHELYKTV